MSDLSENRSKSDLQIIMAIIILQVQPPQTLLLQPTNCYISTHIKPKTTARERPMYLLFAYTELKWRRETKLRCNSSSSLMKSRTGCFSVSAVQSYLECAGAQDLSGILSGRQWITNLSAWVLCTVLSFLKWRNRSYGQNNFSLLKFSGSV